MKGTMFVIQPGADFDIQRTDITAPPSLETLQKAVGGYIEMVPFFDTFKGKPCVVYCNEEGKLHELPINYHATHLWQAALGKGPIDDILVGPVVVLTGDSEILE